MQGVRAGIVWRSAAIVPTVNHSDTGMDWWICTSAAMYLRNVCHPGQHRSGTRRYITRSIDNGCISGRQRNLGGHALVYLSASKRRLRQPSHVPLGLPPWVSSREVRTLDVRLALPAPISRYRRIFRSFPLGPVVCGASRLVFAGSPFCHLTMLGSADTGGLFFFYPSRSRRASPSPRPTVHPPASDKNNGQMRRVGDGEKGGRPPRERRQVGNSDRRERYRIVPGPMRTMAVPTRHWSASL